MAEPVRCAHGPRTECQGVTPAAALLLLYMPGPKQAYMPTCTAVENSSFDDEAVLKVQVLAYTWHSWQTWPVKHSNDHVSSSCIAAATALGLLALTTH